MKRVTSFFLRLRASSPVAAACGYLERFYVVIIAAIWRVQPELLFDAGYYRANCAEVTRWRMDPLFHFLRYGYLEGRKPHPLFDTQYYLSRYPDVKRGRVNPLIHYLRFGGIEGRQPHPDFDGGFYLRRYPDVAAARTNPLVHFLRFGAEEGRLPHPDFDGELYLLANPDVAAARLDPLLHFVRHGAAENRLIRRPGPERLGPPECLLPVSRRVQRNVPGYPVDVIIPVFKGVEETRACLASVLSSPCTTPFRIIVVNDFSPEPALANYVRHLAASNRITLIENPKNLGFVESVNAGMRVSDRDIVLLNSDTIVFPHWLDRLAACAYADERTGTVSPFSNSATICSYPEFCANNKIAPSVDLAALDNAFDEVNRGRSIEVPTTVGFCMYIRRECLQETGLFDAAAFGIGYGEENDFCMRSLEKGWKHKLACDVFVYHAGSVSFGEASSRQRAAMRTLIARHPQYPGLVHRHVEADPASAYRTAVTAYRIRNSGRRAFLSVVHPLGGGVVQHVRELAALTAADVIWLNMKPVAPGRVFIECSDEAYRFSLSLDPGEEYQHLLTLIRACGVERVHIHHLMGYNSDLLPLVRDLQLPFDFTVHDYYMICPQVNLSDSNGNYCAEPDAIGCDSCLSKRPPGVGPTDIASWRAKYAWAFIRADRVITPSADVAARIARYYPQANVVPAEHLGAATSGVVFPRPLARNECLRIAVLGTMAVHKGFNLLRECAAIAQTSALPLEFTLIGNVETGLPHDRLPFRETGPYQLSELPELLDRIAPHLVWFPARWPETFSYTLSTCLELGFPIAAHDTGAFPERVGGRPWTWIAPHDLSASDWVDLLLRIRKEHFIPGTGPCPPVRRPRALADFYPSKYLSDEGLTTLTTRLRSDSRSRPILVAAAVASESTGEIQACGYVRVIQPLTHPKVAETVRLVLTQPADLVGAKADVVLVQRTQVQDVGLAHRIVESCRHLGSRLVFEIDDDLFGIPIEHPEHDKYVAITKAARIIAASADVVIVSTSALREKMLQYNQHVLVVPNYLDERLWEVKLRPSPPPAGSVRIVYAGTPSHQPDLAFLGEAVRELPPQVRRRIEIEVVGVAGGTNSDWFTSLSVPREIAASYPRFVQWIQKSNRWNWGVAPLLDTEFNRSKSALKFLEYSALGLPSMCSDVSVYREKVDPEADGLLIPNDLQSWRHALIRAVNDAALWTRLQSRCEFLVRENTIGANADRITSVWLDIASHSVPTAIGREAGR